MSTYPNKVDNFIEKLNKLNNNTYVIEEEIVTSNGVYEAELEHDNVNIKTINVYTGTKLTGDKIETYITSTPSLAPWKTIIKIFSSIAPLYISYETLGDQIEAEDINKLQDSIVNTQKAVNSEIDRAINAETVLTDDLNAEIKRAEDFENTLTDNLNSEISRAKSSEDILTKNLNAEAARAEDAENTLSNNLNSEIQRAKQSEDSIKTDLNNNRPNWDDAYTKRHIHNNKSVVDGLGENTNGDLTYKGGKIVSTTINGLTDDVTIEGGNNITIVKDGNKIVVAAAGTQEKIVTNTPINISASDWALDTTVTPNIYTAQIQHNLNDSNIIIGVYNGTQKLELVGITIKDTNSIILSNPEAIDCKVVINSSGQPTEVIDNLDSSESNKALSAKQGNVLKELISSIQGGILLGETLDNANPVSLFLKIIG